MSYLSLRKIKYFLDVILILTYKEIKVKYKGSILGIFWSILHPLFLTVVFYVAFKFILRVPTENYVIYLLTGLFPWQWFVNSVLSSCVSLIGNVSLIKKVNFPKSLIPLSNVLNDAFHFTISLPVILIFYFFYEIPLKFVCFYGVFLNMISQFCITYGFALIVSSVNVFFRDLERFLLIGLNMLFYLTPIVYEVKLIPENFQKYMILNPMFLIVENWHNIFLKGYLDLGFYVLSLFWGGILLTIGICIFQRLSPRFAEVL